MMTAELATNYKLVFHNDTSGLGMSHNLRNSRTFKYVIGVRSYIWAYMQAFTYN